MTTEIREPTDWEIAVWDREGQNLPIGPLTLEQHESEVAFAAYREEEQREYEEQMRLGGRTICPECHNRSVKHSTVCTLGYPGHPGADYSDYGKCETEGCNYKDLA